ncbi:sialate O-acetylesterase [Anopheles sinensis]|uniref:Sialate O-acetylesterase n=1 Tax=Anopheles sinensis TaxID=74873 RepID=A0A084VIN3_ANOSI|nr:sialate O-acetylesterase [Anopheles sinensis]
MLNRSNLRRRSANVSPTSASTAQHIASGRWQKMSGQQLVPSRFRCALLSEGENAISLSVNGGRCTY